MDFFEVASKRTSVRSFKNKVIDRDILKKIVQTGNQAPISRFAKLHFTVIEDAFLIDKIDVSVQNEVKDMGLSEYAPSRYSFGAPVLVIISAESPTIAGQEEQSTGAVASAAIAAENIILAATAEGIGSCITVSMMLGLGENSEILRKEVGIPDNYVPTIGVLLGYSDEDKPNKRHRDDSNITFSVDLDFEQF